MESLVYIFTFIFSAYLMIGVLLLPFWYWKGLYAIDPKTEGTHWFFKLLITPGLIGLWPVLLPKWLKNRKQ